MDKTGENSKGRVEHFTLRQQVAAILRKDILRGRYLPGDRIVEAEIAGNLKISRGPVREAIRQLEEEGLVTYSNNKGCSVTTLNPEDAWEIYLLRADLENLALNLCEGDVGDANLAEMGACIRRMEDAAAADDLAEMVEQDTIFHGMISGAPRKHRLFRLWSSLNNTNYAIFLTVLSANIRPLSAMAGRHQKLLDVLSSKNLEQGCQMIKEHYLSPGRDLLLGVSNAADRA